MTASALLPPAADDARFLLERIGVQERSTTGDVLIARTPLDGSEITRLRGTSRAEASAAIGRAEAAARIWRRVPAPRRGELVRLFGERLRAAKADLGRLVTLEAGKILSEGLGEVQEMIDICDFATGLSRQLYGLTIASERPDHRMMETWHPLGIVGVISAFNFPVAVWSWNAALALVCGNAVVWKPSEKTPLTSLAVEAIFNQAAADFGDAPEGLCELLLGERDIGEALVDDPRVALVSATGSTAMGRAVGPRLAARFARSLLELGGNNAAIVQPSANIELAVRAIAFAAMGTAGQRCTTLRRLIVHADVFDAVLSPLRRAYQSVPIGDPRDPATLVGPLIDRAALGAMQAALGEARAAGGRVTGGDPVSGLAGAYVRPALVELPEPTEVMRRETFAPILYVVKHTDIREAIRIQNEVPQGLSSSIFTRDLQEAELFVGPDGSDCGIANVNIGPSGAEIGGAFGGEKETGGGRESGSDAWKAYMRRATNTVNYGNSLPLAQGVSFNI